MTVDQPLFSCSPRQWLQSGDALTWRRIYPGRTDQAGAARKFAGLLLADTGRRDDAEFITAELVSNALLYTRSGALTPGHGGCFGLEITLGKLAHIAVHDLGGGGTPSLTPEPITYGVLLENGRGLLAISKLATTIGYTGNPTHGHQVWADLTPDH